MKSVVIAEFQLYLYSIFYKRKLILSIYHRLLFFSATVCFDGSKRHLQAKWVRSWTESHLSYLCYIIHKLFFIEVGQTNFALPNGGRGASFVMKYLHWQSLCSIAKKGLVQSFATLTLRNPLLPEAFENRKYFRTELKKHHNICPVILDSVSGFSPVSNYSIIFFVKLSFCWVLIV